MVLDSIFLCVFVCDTPVDSLIELCQEEHGSDSPVLVSPLMSPKELYISQDLLNHGCKLN